MYLVFNALVAERANAQFLLYFLCRPVSIINLWFESLNFDICILIFGFFISDKYFSNPILVLKVAYVLLIKCTREGLENSFVYKTRFIFVWIYKKG